MQLIPQRTLILTFFCAVVAMLTGCANIQPKIDAFEQQSKRLGTIYAQVNKVQTPDEWGFCNSSRVSTQDKAAICKQGIQAVQVSWVAKNGRTYALPEAVPTNIKIEAGSIVMLDMSKPMAQHFTAVVSLEETETCRWDGRRNSLLDGSVRKATTFTGVFVAVAAVPVLAVPGLMYGRGELGGIVCNSWNYQEAYKDKDIDSLMDIF